MLANRLAHIVDVLGSGLMIANVVRPRLDRSKGIRLTTIAAATRSPQRSERVQRWWR
jgi:hypothetical protein